MPLDMPPQPAYHVERAAPAQSGEFARIAAAARSMSGDRVASSPVSRMLPPIDPAAPAVTHDDRTAMAAAQRANWRADLARGVEPLPDSYIGDRIRVAVAFSAARDGSARTGMDREAAQGLRCRMVALAMDRRAGEYVVGGEAAAKAARASVSRDELAFCANAAAGARARGAPTAREAVRPVSVVPALRRAQPVRLDLAASRRVSVDPTPSARVSIDPTPSRRVSVSPASRPHGAAYASLSVGTGR